MLILDTQQDITGVSQEDQFFLGGFDVQLKVDSLQESSKLSGVDSPWSLPSGTLRLGAAARPELGKLALDVHRRSFKNWLSQRIQHVARTPTEAVEVLVVGSLVGGTSAGVLPELGGLVQGTLSHLGREGWVVGLGISSRVFTDFLIPDVQNLFTKNQELSLNWLSAELTTAKHTITDTNKSYDAFYVVDSGASYGSDLIGRIAEMVTQAWLAHERSDFPLELPASDEDGTLLLSFWNDERPTLDLLWGPPNQFVRVPTEPIGKSFGVFFHVPTFQSRWSEQIEMLRRLIRDPRVSESQIQNFLEQHPDFLTGFEYNRAVPQVQLQGRSESSLIPDFMLVPYNNDLADIVELKHPQHRLLVSENRFPRFSATVAGALAQLRAYEEYFEREEHRRRLLDKYGFTAYKPRLSLVVGRSSAISSPLIFRKVTAEYPNVTVLTYDDVIAKAERLLDKKFNS